ncbi:hypothetical protein RRG08_024740 [Elysia crispata]|uniref:Uncharacterized protein n=1 Tax=Elysia crispata TaxID=231223 RepID=A0AAE0YF71_9GAST|nr:hypothetical protein RRG08_024740 [Elysia crispata]
MRGNNRFGLLLPRSVLAELQTVAVDEMPTATDFYLDSLFDLLQQHCSGSLDLLYGSSDLDLELDLSGIAIMKVGRKLAIYSSMVRAE